MKQQGDSMHFLVDMLKSLVDSYRLLVASAAELNNIYEARSSQVKIVIKRTEAVGELIDEIVEIIDECSGPYFEYCKLKGKFIHSHANTDEIFTEINNELSLQNSNVKRNDE